MCDYCDGDVVNNVCLTCGYDYSALVETGEYSFEEVESD